jgi:ElaB/YqjD/DUF883 family membrane-anchored ribosome-binding protein
MELRTGEFNRAKGKIADDLKMIVSDGEDLLKAAASASGEGLTAMREQFAGKVLSVRTRLSDGSHRVVEKARQANDFVHGSPWTAIGVATAVGLLIGFLAAKRNSTIDEATR